MRSQSEMMNLIIGVAQDDENIRAALMNGSRVNHKVKPDLLQDYDIVYLVHELSKYEENPSWIDVFGSRIIMQMPDTISVVPAPPSHGSERLVYLMLFKDHNRIDLTVRPVATQDLFSDSLTKVLMDKDQLFPATIHPSEADYLVKRPDQKQFADCCNEFWWVSTYVVKGLLRRETTYAKGMMEKPLRDMFMMMMGWHAGALNQFSINLGSSYRFLEQYLDVELWNAIIATYPDARLENIWSSLKAMTSLFDEIALHNARLLSLSYNASEATNARAYILEMEKHR
jgi:aminoglycoside 6-adenylyltransferase